MIFSRALISKRYKEKVADTVTCCWNQILKSWFYFILFFFLVGLNVNMAAQNDVSPQWGSNLPKL